MEVFKGMVLQMREDGWGIGDWELPEWERGFPQVVVVGWTESGRILVHGLEGVPLNPPDYYEGELYEAACCPETFGYDFDGDHRVCHYTIPKQEIK